MTQPIILMQSRTGSSAIASVFRAHGFWTGADDIKTHGYITHENQTVKRFVKAKWKEEVKQRPITVEKNDWYAFKRLIASIYSNHPRWVWKGAAYIAPLWMLALDDPLFVMVRRNLGDAVASLLKKNRLVARKYGETEMLRRYTKAYEYMDRVADMHGGVWVNIEEVWDGDFALLQAAIEASGAEWDEGKARASLRLRKR